MGFREIDGACVDAREALRLVSDVQHAGNFERIESIARSANEAGAQAGRDLWREVRIAKAEYVAVIEAAG